MIAVVGGTGVIGGAIVAALRAAGEEILVTTSSTELAARSGYRWADMLQPRTLPDAIAGADVVVQSANFASYPIERRRRVQTFMAFDGVGTEHLVEAA